MDQFRLCYVENCWAWFTTCPLDEQYGDDWNDRPYEYNAGLPYEWAPHRETSKYHILKIAFDADVRPPRSPAWSVEDINAGKTY